MAKEKCGLETYESADDECTWWHGDLLDLNSARRGHFGIVFGINLASD